MSNSRKKTRLGPQTVAFPELYGDVEIDPEESTETTLVFKHEGESPPGFAGAPIEVNVVKNRGGSQTDSPDGWIAVEIWTRNGVYMTAFNGRCIRVFDRRKGKDAATHRLLGASLSGGQRQSKAETELAQPLPLPGMKAVFRIAGVRGRKDRFVVTSRVERVVLRLGVTTLESISSAEAFHELTARFFVRS